MSKLLWAPRLLAVAVSLFLGVFALDAFDTDTSLVQGLPDFLMHLVPAAIVAAVVALAWHREWIGAVLFTALAVAYGVTAREHLSWIAAISGPLLITGALYGWSWISGRRPQVAPR
jgi:ABC-type Mn2+/Zn2+ transport system permease subunit